MGRQRLKTVDGTVVTDRGAPLRGGVAEIFSWGKTTGKAAYAVDAAYYRRLRAARLNAVRIACLDPWQRSNNYPHWDFSVASEREKFLAELDRAVQLATENDLYVLIDYHDIGRLDLEDACRFWDLVAPRYAAHPAVFFELANEPVGYHPECYTDDDLRNQELLFHRVRALAPETHLVLLSFANTAVELVPDGNPVVDVLKRMKGIDWSNASVGIHPYRTLSSKILLEIQQHAPVVVTELDLPVHAGGIPYLYSVIDGAEYGQQPLERHRISWFGWGYEGFEKFEKRFERGLLPDAKAKDYLWEPDVPLPKRLSTGSVVIELLRRPEVHDAFAAMGVKARHVYSCMTLALFAAVLDGIMMLALLPVSLGASQGSFDFFWQDERMARLRPHLPAAVFTYPGTFLGLALFVFTLGLVKSCAHYGLHLYVSRLYRTSSARLANAAFRRYLLFGKSFFDKHGAGNTAAILDYNHDLLNLLKKLLEMVSESFIIGIYLVVMLIISWKLTLVSLLVFPAMHFVRQWIARKTRKPVEESHARTLRAAVKAFEIHRSMPLFRAFTKEEEAAAQHAHLMDEIRRSDFQVWLYEGLLPRAQEVTTLAALLLVLVLAFVVDRGQISAAKLFVFFFVSRLALPQLSVFHEVEMEFFKKTRQVDLFLALFNDNGKYITPPGEKDFTELKDGIYFQKLTFSYPDRDPVLHQVSFTIPKGRITAIVGPSGSGKTTIANLLLRYYDIAPHTIALDGICIRQFHAESLRRSISVVSQDVILLDDTLRGNITFGVDGEVPDAEVDRVIHEAALEEVVASLPLGMDTRIGSEGATLSGGQRQRVALARALLKRAPILVLDEPTSSLDAETEQVVQKAIEGTLAGCTVLMISHRMSTIRRADQVVFLENGRVVESGGLHELIERNGRFFEMWEAQKFDWELTEPALAESAAEA